MKFKSINLYKIASAIQCDSMISKYILYSIVVGDGGVFSKI